MDDDRYNNREIDHFLSDMKAQLDRIEIQTTKTNGRTNANEVEITRINTRITTAIWAFGITLPLILALGGWIFFNELKNLNASISPRVAEVLDSYQLDIVE